MSSDCFPASTRAYGIRATRLDTTGAPLSTATASSRVTTSAIIDLAVNPTYEDGAEIVVRSGRGDICVLEKDNGRLKEVELIVSMCGVPLPLVEMLAGCALLDDGEAMPTVIGAALPNRSDTPDDVQLEFWTLNRKGSTLPYWKHIAPLVTDLRFAEGWRLAYDESKMLKFTGKAVLNPNYAASISGEGPAMGLAAIATALADSPWAFFQIAALPTFDAACPDYDATT